MKNESITQILIIPPFPAFRVSWTPKDRFGDRLSSRAECLAICARQPHTWSIQELVDFTSKPTVCYGKWTIDNRNRCFTWFYVIFYSYVNVYQRVESLNYWYVKKNIAVPTDYPIKIQIDCKSRMSPINQFTVWWQCTHWGVSNFWPIPILGWVKT